MSDWTTIADTTSRVTDPRVSVAISTRDRAHFLRRLVRGLERQTLALHSFEVTIVDDASSDDTAHVLEGLAANSALALRAIRLPSRRGQSGGRNVAWRSSRAPVVAFTDDDCSPVPEWLERGLAALAPEEVLVGHTMPDPSLPRGPFSRTVHRKDERWAPTCNIFYWRSDLEAVDGFDEDYRHLGCEDTDLCLRVRDRLGRRVRFGKEVIVFHDVRPSRFFDALRETQRWTSVGRLISSHPSARSWLYNRRFWHPSHPRVLLAALGLLAAPVFPVSILLAIPWLRFRTKTWRAPGRLRQVYPALPGTFLIDLAETVAVLRGAVRYRVLVI